LLTIDEIEGSIEKFLVHRLHAFGVERTSIFDDLPIRP
jgi:hypothetical protein